MNPGHRLASLKLGTQPVVELVIRPTLDVFETSLGWFVIVNDDRRILQLKFGFSTKVEAIQSFENARLREPGFFHPWQNALQKYADGDPVSFSHFEIDTDWMTPFRAQVINACRQIPYGSTLTYGELAVNAGSPGAARAVGTTMRTNRFPIVVPCHRVVGANGLGGFSASQGVETKRRLLEIENAFPVCDDSPRLFD